MKFDFLGLKTLTVLDRRGRADRASAASTSTSPNLPLDDAKTYEMLGARRDGRRVPAGKFGHARRAAQAASPTASRTSSRWSRSIGRGRWTTFRDYIACKHGAGAARLPPPAARADPEGDLRHHGLPGAGDADRPGAGRLHAGRRRPAAPRHGQEEQGGDGRAAQAASSTAPTAQRRRPRPGRARSSTWWTSSPATASTSRTPPPTRWSPTRPPS